MVSGGLVSWDQDFKLIAIPSVNTFIINYSLLITHHPFIRIVQARHPLSLRNHYYRLSTIFSATLSFALADLRFRFFSASLGVIGFFVTIFSSFTRSAVLNGFSSGCSTVP